MQDPQIIRTEYSEVMKKSYIDYAMSVIVARALPDIRDGLKPVQRRTLYDMHELGIGPDKPFRKCARIVGDTMGKYHPHGDSSIYESLVVLAQDFKKGMTLIDGHGNFGSMEGDGAAAMRYTEARLSPITQEAFLQDIDKDVVDFIPNFDETEEEPEVLPARILNLLVNGAEGIAVGMATSIPSHNLGEVINGVIAYMKNDEITTKGLMKHIQGPDFPTGGIVVNQDDLLSIYESGVGKVRIRGKVDLEEVKGQRNRLVISEIPYTMLGAGIGKFLNDVVNLVENKVTSDILDISNQSSKEGIRIVLEVKKDANIENLTNMLYKKTQLESTFGVNMLSVVDGKPETLGLKKIIEHHVDFQFELATRKYQTLLKKEIDAREIQEGLIKACDVIDLIIEILRGSSKRAEAEECLVYGKTENIRFKSNISKKMASMLRFTERQAKAILDMRLYRLIGLAIEQLKMEHEQTLQKIASYEEILNKYEAMAEVIIADLKDIKKRYNRPRKTICENAEEAVFEVEKIKEQEVVVLLDRFNYVRAIDVSTYERNKEAADSENAQTIFCMNTGRLCIFQADGMMHQVKVSSIPYGKFRDKGQPLDNMSNFDSTVDKLLYVCDQDQMQIGRFLFVTKLGMLKIVSGEEFLVKKRTVSATKLLDGDELVSIQIVNEGHNLVLQTKAGYFLRFEVSEISEKKKGAIGVRGIKLQKADGVDVAYLFFEGMETKGEYKGKNVSLNHLKLGKRDTKGVKR